MKSPFKFLDAYNIADKDTFFGRDLEIESLYSIVYKTPLVLVYGSSGTGKTSLVQCGLANRFDGPDWYPIFIRRNDNINVSVQEVFREALGDDASGDLTKDASLLLRMSLRPVYLLFDQFEELFIRGDEAEQQAFMTSIRALLDADLACKVVLIMREEFTARLYAFDDLIPELFDHRFRVEVMGPSKVKKVIQSSFEKFNITLGEPPEDLLDLMVSKISDPKSGISLPYLQVYLDMLYRDVSEKKFKGTEPGDGEYPALEINKADIERLGQMDNVLERFLDNQIKDLQERLEQKHKSFDGKHIQTVLNVFVTDEGTKNPVSYSTHDELIQLSEKASLLLQDISPELLTDIISNLVTYRILRKRDKHLEVAHDSLALVINKRKSVADRLIQNIRKRLFNALEEYEKTGAFLNKKQLAVFDQYRPQLTLTPELESFLTECEREIERIEDEEQNRALEESKRAQQKKLARVRTILFSVIGLIVIGAAWSITAIVTNKNAKLEQKNNLLTAKADSIQLEQENNIAHMDSISQILVQVDQQIVRMDSILTDDLPPKELVKTVITLKSLVRTDTLTTEEMHHKYATLLDIFTASSYSDDPNTAKRDSVLYTDTVYLSVKLKTPQHSEYIQVKWYSEDGNLIGEPSYYKVDRLQRDSIRWVNIKKDINIAGRYRAEVFNSQGFEIGQVNFKMDNAKADVINLTVAEFRTMKSGTLKNPGPHTVDFKVGDKLYYWVRLKSPYDEKVRIELLDARNKILWSDEYTAESNLGFGSRIISWHGANISGTYYIRVVDDQGQQLEGHSLQIR